MQTPVELLVQSIIPAILAIGFVPKVFMKPQSSRLGGLAIIFAISAIANFVALADKIDLPDRLLRATAMGILPIAVGWLVWFVAWRRR